MPETMRAVMVEQAGGDLELEERPVPSPGRDEALIGGSKSVTGHASGSARDSEDTLIFSALSGVRPMIETLPLESAAEAFAKMINGDARFRMVITTGAA